METVSTVGSALTNSFSVGFVKLFDVAGLKRNFAKSIFYNCQDLDGSSAVALLLL